MRPGCFTHLLFNRNVLQAEGWDIYLNFSCYSAFILSIICVHAIDFFFQSNVKRHRVKGVFLTISRPHMATFLGMRCNHRKSLWTQSPSTLTRYLSYQAATWPMNAYIFTRPFLLCIVYLYSALAPPGTMTSIMGLVTVPVIYYPYILIAFDLLMGGPHTAALSVAGAVVGHVWWWTVWGGELASQGVLHNRARAPQWLCNYMGQTNQAGGPPSAGGTAQALARGGIHVTAPRRAAEAGDPTGHTWGSGRRLGN